MLKSLDPLLTAELLYALRGMGHGDEIVVCDANFPAESVARHTHFGRAIRLEGVGSARAAKAILSVMPLDSFIEDRANRMEVVGAPDEVTEVQAEVQAVIDASGDPAAGPLTSIERFAFYERAKKAYAIVATGERRFYGCFVFAKGVIEPDA
ncbi:MAG: RbsD/FucU domain-containing protein [Pseudomonadota bacterium]